MDFVYVPWPLAYGLILTTIPSHSVPSSNAAQFRHKLSHYFFLQPRLVMQIGINKNNINTLVPERERLKRLSREVSRNLWKERQGGVGPKQRAGSATHGVDE